MAALAVAEGAAQGADLNLQIRFFDEGLRPDAGDQFLLADHLAGAFDQSGQNVEGAAAEPHRLVALEQEPLRRKEPERAKRDRVSVHGAGRRTHSPEIWTFAPRCRVRPWSVLLSAADGLSEIDDLVATGADHGLRHVESEARGHPPAIARVAPICNCSPCSVPPSLGSIGIARPTRRDSGVLSAMHLHDFQFGIGFIVELAVWLATSTCSSTSLSAGKRN